MTKLAAAVTILVSLWVVPVSAEDALNFDTDYAIFRGQDNRSIVELYLLARRNLLTWTASDAGFVGSFDVETLIMKDNVAIYRQKDAINDRTDDTTSISDASQIPYQLVLHMDPGLYTVQMKLRDPANPSRYGKKVIGLDVPDLGGDTLKLSQIEIGLQAFIANEAGPFTKYGYDVIPYSTLIFNPQVNHFFYFAEVYNLSAERKAKYQYHCELAGSAGNVVHQTEVKVFDTPAAMSIILDELTLPDLKSDIYTLSLIVDDLAARKTARTSKKIYYSKPMDFTGGDLAAMSTVSEAKLDTIYRILEPLMTSFEVNMYKKSTPTGKREFFQNFWLQRDPTPATPLNEYRVEIENRIREADERFSKQMFYGPFTDRGKVWVKYGKPSDIESYMYRMEGKPYEIWYYTQIEGGVQFVFIDENGLGNPELVHSTKSGEISNEYWNLEIEE